MVYHLCYTSFMPTTSPRINVVLEKPLFEIIQKIARKDEVSLSSKVHDLVREALELHEDAALAAFASGRARTFKREKALTHAQAWGRGRRG